MKLSLTPAELRQLAFRPTVDESDGSLPTMQLIVDGQATGFPTPIVRGSITRFPVHVENMTMASRVEIRVT